MFFLVKSFVLFYVFFELSVFPILFLVIYWGYQIERLQATMFIVGYTIFFSIPCFMVIVKILQNSLIFTINTSIILNKIPIAIIIITFFVKIPIFSVHM